MNTHKRRKLWYEIVSYNSYFLKMAIDDSEFTEETVVSGSGIAVEGHGWTSVTSRTPILGSGRIGDHDHDG